MIFQLVAVFKVIFPGPDQVVDISVVAQMQIPMVRFTTEVLQLQYIGQVVVACCAGPSVRAQLWETVEIPQLQLVLFWTVATCRCVQR